MIVWGDGAGERRDGGVRWSGGVVEWCREAEDRTDRTEAVD